MPKPLAGLTVVVTRPRAQAAGFARDLKACGARVVLAPAVRIAPSSARAGLDAALRALARFDAAVFTSANAVRSVFARAAALRLTPAAPAQVYAVGPETAAALRRRGWRPRALPGAFRGEALARSMGRVRGLRVLLPRAREAREDLPGLLRRAGAQVTVVEAYRTLADPGPARRLRRRALAGSLDAVAFASPSAARAFVAGLGRPACRRLFARAAAASIGPVTSEALRELGFPPSVEARRATARGLLDALKRHYRERAK